MIKKYQKTAQLFDYTTMSTGSNNAYLKSDGTLQGDNAWNVTDYIPCDGVNFVLAEVGGNAPSICFYDSNKTFISGTQYNTGGVGTKAAIYATASSNAKYIRFSYRTGTLPDDVAQLMLNEGSTALPYEPYGDSFKDWFYREYGTETETFTSLPQTIIGDGQNISAWSMKGNMSQSGTPTPSNPIYPTECGEKTANLSPVNTLTGTSSSVRTQFNTAFSGLQFEADTQYTISLKFTGNYGYNYGIFKVCFTHTDDTTTKSGWITTNPDITTILTSTAGKTVQSVTITDFNNPVDSTEMTNIMLNKGATALPYEPSGLYKIPILSNGVSYPIYLSEPIRKIGDSVDTAPSTGTANRAIKKLVLTGQESWSEYGTGTGHFYYISLSPYAMINIYPVCSHYNTVRVASEGKQLRVYESYESTTDFTTYLQQQYANGTPVTVWYVLATATTESFTAPTLPTSGSQQTFDVDTTLKPSEVSLTYHGWHEHSDTKYTSG